MVLSDSDTTWCNSRAVSTRVCGLANCRCRKLVAYSSSFPPSLISLRGRIAGITACCLGLFDQGTFYPAIGIQLRVTLAQPICAEVVHGLGVFDFNCLDD